MLPRHSLITRFSDNLVKLSGLVKARSSNNLNDASQILETIVRLVLNAQFGWKLANLNRVSKNFPTADLADPKAGVAVQVTVQNNPRKISHTLEKAAIHSLPKGVSRLILFFLITRAPSTPKNVVTPKKITFEVWDIPMVVAQAAEIDDLKRLRRAVELLEDEIETVEEREKAEKPKSEPKLKARFMEYGGKLSRIKECKTDLPSYAIELWIVGAPDKTNQVAFEILDEEVEDRNWTIKKKRTVTARQFITDDMNLYGDVEIMARGEGPRTAWVATSTLYEALMEYYRERKIGKEVRAALKQIKDN